MRSTIPDTVTARMQRLRRRLTGGGSFNRCGSGHQRRHACLGGLCGLESLEPRVMLTTVPNDPMFGDQWSLEAAGDIDIDATTAWDTTTGSWDTVVAVSDGMINLAHPDLYLNIWLNQGEIPAAKMAALTDVDSDGRITFFDLNDPANAAHVSDVDHSDTAVGYAGTWADGETTYGGQPPQLVVNGGATLSPVEDTWVRESQPGTSYGNDGISVWNTYHTEQRRWGLIEFNVSGQSLTSLDLNLYSHETGFSDDPIPLNQSAAIIDISSTGKTIENLTWNDVVGLAQTSLETLGTIDAPAPVKDVDGYKTSTASPADLAAVQVVADGSGQLVILMMADDGTTEPANGFIDGYDLRLDPTWADGLDTDGNGFVDDLNGFDMTTEPSSHGNGVAGIIGAIGNNGEGITGVNWKVSLMGIRFATSDGINYATMMKRDYGVNVVAVNTSWTSPDGPALDQAIQDAGAEEILLIAAAGNSGTDNDASAVYPPSYPYDNIVSVTGVTSGNTQIYNYGANSVDLGAPTCIRTTTAGVGYNSSFCGTSASAPVTAGAVALLATAAPALRAVEIKEALLQGVDPYNPGGGASVTNGLLNLGTSMELVTSQATLPYTEDFDDGTSNSLGFPLGVWRVDGDHYDARPDQSGLGDAVSLLRVANPLLSGVQIDAQVRGIDGGAGFFKNAVIIFDYQSENNFKYAGAYFGGDEWRMGHVIGGMWTDDQTSSETLDLATDYDLRVNLSGTIATLTAGGMEKISFDFGELLSDGELGLGTQNAVAQFDNVMVSESFVPSTTRGDMNGDFLVNLGDAALLIQALVDRDGYDAAYPLLNADINGDVDENSAFDFGDIPAFSQMFDYSPGATLSPIEDTWVRESSPTTNYDDDGISVWNNDSGEPSNGRRWGIVEFDVSGLALQSMTLDLWSQVWTFGDDDDPLKQSAAIIDISSTGKLVQQLVWNDVAGLAQTSLETLGTYDILDPDSDPNVPEYKSSAASVADIAAVQAIADGSGQLVILMMGDDTGATNYSGTWGDSETSYGGQPPQLLINGGAPATAFAAASASAAVIAENEAMDVTLATVDTAQSLLESVSTSPMAFDSSPRPASPGRALDVLEEHVATRTTDADELLLAIDRVLGDPRNDAQSVNVLAAGAHQQGTSDHPASEWDEALLDVLEERLS